MYFQQEEFHLCCWTQRKSIEKMAKKVTSKKAATAASKVLSDKRTSKASKTAAGSALSQREKPKRKTK